MFTLCDANYGMKERSDVKVTNTSFEDLSLNFHLPWVGSHTLSRYRDRAAETLPKIMGIAIEKQEDNQHIFLS